MAASALSVLMDASTIATVVASVAIVTRGSRHALEAERQGGEENDTSAVLQVSSRQALLFPVAGSVMLLVMFYFFAQVQVRVSELQPAAMAVPPGRLESTAFGSPPRIAISFSTW